MKTLEQLLTFGSYAGLGLLLSCTPDTADNKNKTDDSGSESCVAWEQTYGGTGSYTFYSVQQTTDGGYVLAGLTKSSGTYDGWLIKTDKDGNKQWEQTFGGNESDEIRSVQQTTDGGYVLAGDTSSSGSYDGWLIKTDADGNKRWEQTFGGSDYNYIPSVQQTTDGGYVLAGYRTSSGTGYDGWLVKTDENGNKQWEQTFGGSDHTDGIYSVQQTRDGGYVLAGSTLSSGAYDGWLVKACDL